MSGTESNSREGQLSFAQLTGESAKDWSAAQLTFAMRLMLRVIQHDRGYSRLSHAKQDVLARTGKSKDSMKVWLSYSKGRTNIPWPLVDLLRVEYGLMAPLSLQEMTEARLELVRVLATELADAEGFHLDC